VHRLVDAAQATALDVRAFEIELHTARAEEVEALEESDLSRSELALLSGLRSELFRAPESPTLPDALPGLEALHGRLLRDHPELARLRAAYDVAEASLREAVAAGRSDLGLEPSMEREEDEETYGLGLAVEIPLFDRNQPEIAAQFAAREAARQAYRSALSRSLIAVGAARRLVEQRARRRAILADDALPAAQSAVELAARALQAGQSDALHFLAAARAERGVRLDLLAAEEAHLAAWSDLETACGSPLLQFESTRSERAPDGGSR